MSNEPITRVYGHGGITLTAYPSSGRVGVEVRAENAVMDYSDLLDFADKIRKPSTVTTTEAVQIWEDSVGDSGKPPTDEELAAFANAVLHEGSEA